MKLNQDHFIQSTLYHLIMLKNLRII